MKDPSENTTLYMVVPEPKGRQYYSDRRVRYFTQRNHVDQYVQSLEWQKRAYKIYEAPISWKLVADSPSEEVVAGD